MSTKNNKKKFNVIINCNLKIQVIAEDYNDAMIEAENCELPEEYIEDSFEIVKVLDEDENEITK